MVIAADIPVKVSRRVMKTLHLDAEKTAAVINLVYVSDKEEGIKRNKAAEGFEFFYKGKKLKDEATLLRIKKLVLPPAWTDVWICPNPDGHLQATGLDALGRKQYKYHALWTSFRNQTKFYHLLEFGKCLPQIRQQVAKDLRETQLSLTKVLALVVTLMEETTIRIGNNAYEKLYGSFGLTTLKDKHVDINGATVKFSFKGKKGVEHEVQLKSKKLASIVKQCKDIPGKELFQYYDAEGRRQCIDSGMVNDYIKTVSGGSFTAKDFRTWTGTVQALVKLKETGCCETAAETKKKIVEVLDHVAKQLGNTRAVCKKYYVHPVVFNLYENKSLEKYWNALEKLVGNSPYDLKPEEKLLMKILETN